MASLEITATGTSQNVALPGQASADSAVVINKGQQAVFVTFGDADAVASTVDVLVSPGQASTFDTTSGISTATIAASHGGTGYAVGDLVEVTQSGAGGGLLEVLTETAGVVATLGVVNAGKGYSAANGLATVAQSGAGTGLEVDVTAVADVTNIAVITAGAAFASRLEVIAAN